MKELAKILKDKFGNSATARRAQLRNEILVRGNEILAELGKGWSVARHLESLNRNQGNNLQLQNLCRTRAPVAASNRQNQSR